MSRVKKAMKIALFGTLGVLVAGAAAFLLLRYISGKLVLDGDGMINKNYFVCGYSSYGGMENSSEEIVLTEVTGNVTVTSRQQNGDEETTKTNDVPEEAAEKLKDIYKKYKVESWGELPVSEITAEDAPTVRIWFETYEKTTVIYDYQEIPENGYSIFREVYDVLKSYVD